MKKILFLLCGFAAICLMVSAFAGEKQPVSAGVKADAVKMDVGQLTQEVTALQARIKALEERLGKLEKAEPFKLVTAPPVINPAPQSITIPQIAADPNRPPNAWGEREFNGLKYYLIPLGAQEN